MPCRRENTKGSALHSLWLLTFFFLFAFVQAQTDTTTTVKGDTVIRLKQPVRLHSPRKAALYSAVLPGLGQAYNRKYWKIPVIYAGLGGLVYSFSVNQRKYVTYRDALRLRLDDDPATTDAYGSVYSDDDLTRLYQYYHRYRDLSAIGVVAVWLLNIVDASVDAHLFRFDVSDDLSLHYQPAMIPATAGQYRFGATLQIKF